MDRQARIVALKLMVEIIEGQGHDGFPLEGSMSFGLLHEHNKLENYENMGEEMNVLIGKLKNNIKALEDGFTASEDGHLHLCSPD